MQKSKNKIKFSSRFSKKKKILPLLFALLFGGIGIYLLFSTSAFVPVMRFNDGEFTSLSPFKLHNGTMQENQTITIQASGVGGIPTTGVKAISINVTVAGSSKAGYLTLFPSNVAKPHASSINFTSQTTAINNELSVNIGADGKFNIFNAFGQTQIIIDVNGFYSNESGPDGNRFIPITPARIFDSKINSAKINQIQVAGTGGVPLTGVGSVVINVTAAEPTTNSYITMFPSDATTPNSSILNFSAKVGAIANQVTMKLGANGQINAINASGSVRMIIDVSGYYTTEGNRFVGITPTRIQDSGFAENQTKRIKVMGTSGIPASHVKAVLVNVAAASPTKAGYLTVFPSDSNLPMTSSLNFTTSSGAISNQIITKVSADGYISVHNRFGNTRVILDISGYYLNNDSLETIPYDATKKMPTNPNVSLNLVKGDVSYGPSPSHTYDIYESANQPDKSSVNQDTLVWFYGGGWIGGDNSLSTAADAIAKHLAAEYGYKLVAVDYRKTGEASYPAQYQDAIAVIKDLKSKASNLDINPDRLIVGGFSAGGDIASMEAYAYNIPEFQPTWLSPTVAAQSGKVYRIVTFATPFNKVSWAQNYLPNASPIAGLNKLINGTGTAPNFVEYAKLNIAQYVDSSDPPHYTVMCQNDEILPFNTQLPDIQTIGSKSSVMFQYGGTSGHTSGLDTNIPALLEYLK